MEETESNMEGKDQLTKEEMAIIKSYSKRITGYYEDGTAGTWYPMFSKPPPAKDDSWVSENQERFFKGTPNEFAYYRWYLSELGAVMAMEFAPNGAYIVVGHASGAIQVGANELRTFSGRQAPKAHDNFKALHLRLKMIKRRRKRPGNTELDMKHCAMWCL